MDIRNGAVHVGWREPRFFLFISHFLFLSCDLWHTRLACMSADGTEEANPRLIRFFFARTRLLLA